MLFAGVASGVFAQQTPTIQLEGSGMRAKLDVPAGKTTVHLCGLTPGYVYTVLALKAVYDLPVNIHLSPSADLIQSAVRIDAPRERKNALRFTAPTGCADVLVDAITDQPAPAIPLILSIRCANCAKEDTGGSTKETALAAKPAANLSVVSGVPANSLIKNTLIGGNCFEVTNITSTGPANALGTFSNGSSTIGIENGVVMCTGNVNILPGPNDSIGASGNYNGNFGSNLVQEPIPWLFAKIYVA